MSNTGKYVLLDRDGVIAAHHSEFTRSTEQVLLLPFVPEALAVLKERGVGAVIYHHEKGVAEGVLNAETVSAINNHLVELLEQAASKDIITGIVSTDTPITAEMPEVKVKAGLLLRAAAQYGIDLKNSWVAGDEEADMEAAQMTGAKACLVRQGRGHQAARAYGRKPQGSWIPDLIARDLFSAVGRLTE